MHLRQLSIEKEASAVSPVKDLKEDRCEKYSEQAQSAQRITKVSRTADTRETTATKGGAALSVLGIYVARLVLWGPLLQWVHSTKMPSWTSSTLIYTLYVAMVVLSGAIVGRMPDRRGRIEGVLLGNVIFYTLVNAVLMIGPRFGLPPLHYTIPEIIETMIGVVTLAATQIAVAEMVARRPKRKPIEPTEDDTCSAIVASIF